MGSGIGLALGAGFMSAGLAQAVSDHHRAARLAEVAGGGLSEAMLQREVNAMDPAAARLARRHDLTVAANAMGSPEAWPANPLARQPAGRRGGALQAARDLDCLTEAVYFEARGETPRGQAAVAQVVMNRVANPNFPKTVCGVVFQHASAHGCQFSFACDGSMSHGLEAEAWDRARQVAERALSGVVLAQIGGATHFHAIGVQPTWGPQMLRVAQVGLHVFYRVNPHAPPARDDAAPVFASMPMTPTANLRLAGAVLEKAAAIAAPAAGQLASSQLASSQLASSKAVAAEPKGAAPAAASADRAGEPASDRAPADSDR